MISQGDPITDSETPAVKSKVDLQDLIDGGLASIVRLKSYASRVVILLALVGNTLAVLAQAVNKQTTIPVMNNRRLGSLRAAIAHIAPAGTIHLNLAHYPNDYPDKLASGHQYDYADAWSGPNLAVSVLEI
jgi:hypothetical protein